MPDIERGPFAGRSTAAAPKPDDTLGQQLDEAAAKTPVAPEQETRLGPGVIDKTTGEFIHAPINKPADLARRSEPAAAPIVARRVIAAEQMAVYKMPSLHLFQDVGKEPEVWGAHQKGQWIDSLNFKAVDPKLRVVPVFYYSEVLVWYGKNQQRPKGEAPVVERFNYMHQVHEQYRGKRGIWDVIEYMNWVLALEGADFPFVIQHKSTHIDAAKSLNFMHEARKGLNKPHGAYLLSSRDRSNADGKWKVPVYVTASPADAPEELAEMAKAFEAMFFGRPIAVDDPEEGGDTHEAPTSAGAPAVADDATPV